jgi:membrane protease YdiL (CAAX protease family)
MNEARFKRLEDPASDFPFYNGIPTPISNRQWLFVVVMVVVGSARMVLTLPWIMTKNIWVSTGAHIVNDWLLITMTLLGAGLVGKV